MTHQSDGRWRGKTTSLMTSAPRSRIVLPSFVQIIPITTLLPLCTFWFIIVMYIAFGASTFNDLANRDLKWYNDTTMIQLCNDTMIQLYNDIMMQWPLFARYFLFSYSSNHAKRPSTTIRWRCFVIRRSLNININDRDGWWCVLLAASYINVFPGTGKLSVSDSKQL